MLPTDPILLLGTVKDTFDEEKLGRVQVEIQSYGDKALVLPWLRLMQPTASNLTGHLWLPEVGDEVVILRGDGNNPDGMIILGSVYNGANLPATPPKDKKNNVKQIVTRSGHQLTFSDESGKESITIADALEPDKAKVSIVMDKKAATITLFGEKDVIVKSKTQVTVDAKKVLIEPSEGSAVTITSSKALDLVSQKDLTLQGKNVNILGGSIAVAGDSSVDISGSSIKLGG